MPGIRPLLAAMGLVLGLLAAAPAHAAAERSAGLETIVQDDALFLHRPAEEVEATLDRLDALGVDRIRVSANWSVLTRDAGEEQRPANFDAADPAAYEQRRWAALDRVVRLAQERDLRVMIDVAFFAPRWASDDVSGPGRLGRTHVDPREFARFAAAVARRYTGTFIVPDAEPVEPNEDEEFLDELFGGTGFSDAPDIAPVITPLPRVDVFTLWNEPNLSVFLRPQWVRVRGRFRPRSPRLYREMVARGYPAVKRANPEATVLVGATSMGGSYVGNGSGSVPPLRFIRELACVDRRFAPLRTRACRSFDSIPGDGWSHHPYSYKALPDTPSFRNRRDNVPMAEMPRLVRTLDRLADMGRLAPALRDVWITEYGYETNPPARITAFGPADQARFLPWGEYLAWRLPEVRTFAQFLLRDLPPGPVRVGASRQRPFGEWSSGLDFADGRPKLAALAFQAGLFVQRLGQRRLRVWARLRLGPGPQELAVEVRRPGGTWTVLPTRDLQGGAPADTVTADGQGVVERRARASGDPRTRYRLRLLGEHEAGTMPAVRAAPRRARRP